MREDLARFIEDTNTRFGTAPKNWRKKLSWAQKSAAIDSTLLTLETIADIVRQLESGAIDQSQVPPEILEAFRLQFPNVNDLAHFLQEHSDPEEMRGILAGLKGKLFELDHVSYLNAGHLPSGFIARLAESSTQPGYDVLIEGPDNRIVEFLQDKATHSLSLVNEALARYPEIDVAVPHELALRVGALDQVIDSGVSEEAIDAKLAAIAELEAMSRALTFHLPWLSEIFICAHEGYLILRRRRPIRGFRSRVWQRSLRTLVANAVGQSAAMISGIPGCATLALPLRILIAKADANAALAKSENERCCRFRMVLEKVQHLGGACTQ